MTRRWTRQPLPRRPSSRNIGRSAVGGGGGDVKVFETDLLSYFSEQMEEQDKADEKLHMDAVTGKFRVKRRNHAVGLSDDEDSEEDEEGRRIRSKMKKRQRVNDSIASLGKSDIHCVKTPY